MRLNTKFGTAMLFVAIVLVSTAFIPAASASPLEEASASRGLDISSALSEKPSSVSGLGAAASYTIWQGLTRYHYTQINKQTWHKFNPDLSWFTSSASLRLTVISPTGTQYGPWYDSSDGRMDNRIHFNEADIPIQIPAGLPVGSWTSRVYGQTVSGTITYSYNVYIT
jgi:hypothetical protein